MKMQNVVGNQRTKHRREPDCWMEENRESKWKILKSFR